MKDLRDLEERLLNVYNREEYKVKINISQFAAEILALCNEIRSCMLDELNEEMGLVDVGCWIPISETPPVEGICAVKLKRMSMSGNHEMIPRIAIYKDGGFKVQKTDDVRITHWHLLPQFAR